MTDIPRSLRHLLLAAAEALQEAGDGQVSKLVRDLADPDSRKLKWFMSPEAKAAGLQPPKLAYNDDAGVDLRYFGHEPLEIPPGENRPIPTGIGFEIPRGWYGKISNRTSVGRRGLIPVAQIVDSNFTGVLTLTLHNLNRDKSVILEPGERCAQIVFMPHWSKEISEIAMEDVKKTDRGDGAYGSSGKH